MSCRHGPNDPNCTSHPAYGNGLREGMRRAAEQNPPTPDAEKYEITRVEFIGEHVVLKVKYPNCAKCAYEGQKVMVFLNVTPQQAMMWRRIDPHFRAPESLAHQTHAPSPAARFPGSPEGWSDACVYARGKCKSTTR